MAHPGGRPPLFDSKEELENKIDEYFKEYTGMTILKDNNGEVLLTKNGTPIHEIKPPTITGLAYHLGFVSRQSIYDYEGRNDEFSYIIKRARLCCERFAEEMLYTGKPVGAIFALKNFGWKDERKLDHSGEIGQVIKKEIPKGKTPEEYKKMFKEMQEEIKNDK